MNHDVDGSQLERLLIVSVCLPAKLMDPLNLRVQVVCYGPSSITACRYLDRSFSIPYDETDLFLEPVSVTMLLPSRVFRKKSLKSRSNSIVTGHDSQTT